MFPLFYLLISKQLCAKRNKREGQRIWRRIIPIFMLCSTKAVKLRIFHFTMKVRSNSDLAGFFLHKFNCWRAYVCQIYGSRFDRLKLRETVKFETFDLENEGQGYSTVCQKIDDDSLVDLPSRAKNNVSRFSSIVAIAKKSEISTIWPWKWRSRTWKIWLTFYGLQSLIDMEFNSKEKIIQNCGCWRYCGKWIGS